MASIPGGPSDKLGNEFERLWLIRQLLQLVEGRATNVAIEALGDDEKGTEFWVGRPDGTREAHQCKRENASQGTWSVADLNARRVIASARIQLSRSATYRFVFISSDKAPSMSDLCERARRGDSADVFCNIAVKTSAELKNSFDNLCRYLKIDVSTPTGQADIQDYLRRFQVIQLDKSRVRSDVEELVHAWLTGDPVATVGQLESFTSRNETMGKTLREEEFLLALPTGVGPRDLRKDATLLPRIRDLQSRFDRSYRHLLIRGQVLGRQESKDIVQKIRDGSRLMLIHGPGGCGKSGVIFETIEELKKLSIPYLPLRLDRDKPADSPAKYGEALELPASPSASLIAMADGRPAVLILDQLDAIRWTTAHSANAWDTCERIIDEALRHKNIAVIVVCRTFDVEEDKRIKAWRDGEKDRTVEVKLTNLTDSNLERILTEADIAPIILTSEQRNILRSPQSLYLGLQLFASRKQFPSFNTSTGLMDAFWSDTRANLPDKVDRQPFEAVIDTLVKDMDRRGVAISARSLVSRWKNEVDFLISSNILAENGPNLLFSHQSHFDYLAADQISREIGDGTRQITEWLGQREQSLFRRGQLRQLLTLLRDRNTTRYVATLRELVTSPHVRFHLQHLALQIMANTAEPNLAEANLLGDMLNDDTWRDRVAWQVVAGREQWFDIAHSRGFIQRWLGDMDEKRRYLALRIAESVITVRADAVASLILKKRGPSRSLHLKEVLSRVKPDDLNPEFFRAYRALLRQGEAEALYGHWTQKPDDKPRRIIQIFHSLATNCIEYVEGQTGKSVDKSGRERHMLEGEQGKAILSAAAAEWKFTWRTLLPLAKRMSKVARTFSRRQRRAYNSDLYDLRRSAALYQRMVSRALVTAGRAFAKNDPSGFRQRVQGLGLGISRSVRRIIVSSLRDMPIEHADFVVRWLMSDPRRLSCGLPNRGFYYEATSYVPAVRVLRMFGARISDQLHSELESYIVRYVPKTELDDYRYCHKSFMSDPKGWIRTRSLFVGQFLLLAALPSDRLSLAALSNLGVLRRKFGDSANIMKKHRDGKGGWVGSTIPNDRRLLVSDTQWLKIITRDWSVRGHRWVQLGPDSVGEVSIRTLSRDLNSVAHHQPERFAKLAMSFPTDIDGAYVAAIYRAFGEINAPEKSAGWSPAPLELLANVTRRFAARLKDPEVARAFAWLLQRRCRDLWPDDILELLFDLAKHHPDPAPDEFGTHRSVLGKEQMEGDAVSSSLNSVRGSAAGTIKSLFFTRSDRADFFTAVFESLVQDPHVAVRIAAIGVSVPMLNVDRRQAANLFLKACEHVDDRVLQSREIDEFISYALLDFSDELRPVMDRMLSSSNDKVVERGANWAMEAWMHGEHLQDLMKKTIEGSAVQRQGTMRSVIRAVLDHRGGEFAWKVLINAFDDSDEKVRGHAASILRWDKFFPNDRAIAVTEAFVRSKAFEENLDDFLYGIHDETISLRPFAGVFRVIAHRLSEPPDKRSPMLRRFSGTGLLPNLLLRLYEQSEDDIDARKICLDAWDQLLKQGEWGVLEKLDR